MQLPRTNQGWQFELCDALEKVYPDTPPRAAATGAPLSVFLGEPASFQIAIHPPVTPEHWDGRPLKVSITGALAAAAHIYQVDLVPCALVAAPEHDDNYDRLTPGHYPDLLRPTPSGDITPLLGSWTAAWVDIDATTPGQHSLGITVTTADNATLFTGTVDLEILPHELPPLDIVNTHWFHCDGLANYYGVAVFSEPHWAIIENFIAAAARMNVNSLLTPTWTPPLDTAIGHERTPTQLIGITEIPGTELPGTELPGTDELTYAFDFTNLERWVRICAKHGITHLEIAHLFTQWGAHATPAMYVSTARGLERQFGWDTPATDPRYRKLLESLLPALREFLAHHWAAEKIIFHISDEPHGPTQLQSYREAQAVVADLLVGCTIVDALSDFEFYATGAVPHPVVATDAVAPFLAAAVPNLWVYYCVAQSRHVSNRFIGMPAARNRVIGQQLFAMGCAGFLHWGFNFYNSQGSTRAIDPFNDTCAGGAFAAGDSFMVYPGANGQPWESLRYKVFTQAMNDYRALQWLASLRGRDAVLALLREAGPLTFDEYSRDPEHYLRIRHRVNGLIMERLQHQR